MTLTKEWLQKQITDLEATRDEIPFGLDEDGNNTLAALKLALAGMEAEPVAYMYKDKLHADARFSLYTRLGNWSQEDINEYEITEIPLYAAPQPATVVDADDNFYSWFGREWTEHYQPSQYTTAAKQMLGVMADSAWRAGHRAAMLQAGNHTEQHLDMVNSPVIPGGWVMVPVEPTEDMIIQGFESEPDESFSEEKDWLTYEAMSGCQQAAHRAKLCWAAMIAAAPQQEAE